MLKKQKKGVYNDLKNKDDFRHDSSSLLLVGSILVSSFSKNNYSKFLSNKTNQSNHK